MKRFGNVVAAVAMMIGAFGSVGCKMPGEKAAQPETTPVAQPVDIAPAATPAPAAPAAQKESVAVVATTTTRLPAPPSLRFENPGPAPSAHHRWMRGYWRYDAPRTTYVWAPGFWEDESVVAPFAPPALRYENPGYAPSADYYYAPGYWRWSGREYVWTHGHWTLRRDAGFYFKAQWENVNGRWTRKTVQNDDCRDGDRHHAARQPPRTRTQNPPAPVRKFPPTRGHG